MNNLTIPEIEALICFFQDYEKLAYDYAATYESPLLSAIEKLKDELR